jgi:hypothetical protein
MISSWKKGIKGKKGGGPSQIIYFSRFGVRKRHGINK